MHPNFHRQDASYLLKTLDSVLLSAFIYQKSFSALLSALAGTPSTKAAETVWYLVHSNNPSKLLGQGERDRELLYSKANSESNFGCSSWRGRRKRDQVGSALVLSHHLSKQELYAFQKSTEQWLQTSIKWKKTLHRLQELGLLHLSVVGQVWPAKKLSPKHTSLIELHALVKHPNAIHLSLEEKL